MSYCMIDSKGMDMQSESQDKLWGIIYKQTKFCKYQILYIIYFSYENITKNILPFAYVGFVLFVTIYVT